MQIILAIVADHQQASQLAALIKSRLSVDLIQAAEAGEALLALDNRIPDLVLTSPLMSPFDDGVLDEYLRGLGPAGAHVQTLRIPVLMQAPKRAPRLGFSLRRKAKPETAIQGCEPKVFADEIAHYLVRAAEDKHHASSNPPVVVAQEQAAATSEEQWTRVDEPDAARAAYDTMEDSVSYQPYAGDSDTSAQPVEAAAPATEFPAAYEPYETYVKKPEEPEPVFEPAAVEPVEPIEPAVESIWVAPVEPIPERSVEPDAVEPLEPVPAEAPEPLVLTAQASAAREEVARPALTVETPVVKPATTAEAPVVQPVAEAPVARPATTAEAPVVQPVAEAPVARPATTAEAPVVRPATIAEAPVVRPVATIADAAEAEPHKTTPSFKAALAAIRAAWGKPSPNANALDLKGPAQPPPAATAAEPVPATEPAAPAPRTASMPPPPVTPASPGTDVISAVKPREEPPLEPGPVSTDSRETLEAGADESEEAVEVYEISVEPDLSELESQLITPLKPPARREALPARPDVSSSAVDAEPSMDRRPAEPSGGKRKKGKRSLAPAKARPRGQGEPAQGAPAPGEPVQDEWGIFDPNQCGFAALVDRLDEVSDDEKPETPARKGTKVRVISYS